MTAQVSVLLKQAKGVLMVPAVALGPKRRATSAWCGCWTTGPAAAAQGQVGINNGASAEILSGLKEGEGGGRSQCLRRPAAATAAACDAGRRPGHGAPMSTTAPLLRLRGLRREFPAGDDVIAVLRDVNLDIHAGEMVAIVGQSGSGKSTLMNILGCLDRPPAAATRWPAAKPADGPDELAELRREHFGFIFQRYHLLAT
jgi:hypothetical protein